MIGIGQTYTNLTIYLDGGTFKDCKFQKCHIVYNGLQGVSLIGCEFGEGVTWAFEGPANNISVFLTALYASGATQLIENFFQRIRGQPPGSGPVPTLH